MARRGESVELPLELVGDFPSDWERSTLEKACSLVTDGTHDSPKVSASGFPLVTGKCITGGRIDLDAAYLISDADHRAVIARSRPEFGDILFANIGNSIGELARVEINAEFSIKNVALFKPSQRLKSRFLKYYLLSPLVQNYIRGTTFGSAQPFIGLATLRAFPIPLPPLDEQRAIAHVLGTLDDKIELNRRMNETLEAMARALFKSWFVDFDPVRAKAEGRDPGLPQPLADLFPDSFEDSELGEIPRGWQVQRVGEIGTIVCGKTPPTQVSAHYGDDVPFITIPDMHRRIFATTVQKRLSGAGAKSQEKKMLPVGAICVSCIATAGLVVITSEVSQTNQQINSVVPNQKDATYFWYWSLRNLGDDIKAGGSGGSVLTNLSTGRFAELRLLAGLAGLRSAYHSLVTPIFGRILANEREFRTLTALRDALLPKLLSGELRVPAAERLIEEASA